MSTTTQTPASELSYKDFESDQEVRWCPGCGDYGILKSVQIAFAELGLHKENVVMVSGIGCSSRLPYYMDTYGFHSIHGRAPAIAAGVKLANPDLDVWVITGDGDSLSIGGNHTIHMLRRNVGLKVLMFNNRIYGLTKGQYSPTSEAGKITKSTPWGSLDAPFNPLALALGAGATFVARGIDVIGPHLRRVIKEAHEHEGAAYIEILQNCNIFNDRAFAHVTDKKIRDDMLIDVRHGEPLLYGKENEKGLIWDHNELRAVKIGEEDKSLGRKVSSNDILVWKAEDPNPTLAFALTQLREGIDPSPIGVIRRTKVAKPYEQLVNEQIAMAREKRGERSLKELLYSGKTWEV